MPADTLVNVSPPQESEASPAVDREKLSKALEIIARDSRVEPRRYLEETMVPNGGE